LTDRTTRATQWRFASVLVGTLSSLTVGIVLARLLTPADFGTMAMATVVLGFAGRLSDLGIGSALIQRQTLTDRHIRTAFTMSLLLGLLVTAVAAATARPLAVVIGDSSVFTVLRVLSLGFVIAGTATVSGALLQRQLDFRRQFFVDVGSYVFGYGAVAITLAMRGYGVWSLVWGGLCQSALTACSQWLLTRHPGRLLLGKSETLELLHFGLGATANSCVNYVALNGDSFVVGRWLGSANLGLYNRAYNLMNLPFTYAAGVMSTVLFPAFAHVQNEPKRLQRGYLLMSQLTAMIAAPSLTLLAISAPHLIPSVYGSRWIGVVAPLQILCLAGYFRALYHVGGVVIQSAGWVYKELPRQVLYACFVLAGAVIGSRYGLQGVAAAISLAILYMFMAMGQLALRVTETSWPLYMRAQIGGLLTAVATGAVAFGVRILLESNQASRGITTLAILSASAVPWMIGMLWELGEPAFEPLRTLLPPAGVRLIEALRRGRA
jgi:O-antigen/teichoic acid export membrane protein